MKKNINIVTGKMIREDTRIVFQKLNEAKSSWKDILDAASDAYSDYSKEAVKKASEKDNPLSQDQATKIDKAIEKNTGQKLPPRDYSNLPKTQADVPKTVELPKIDVAGQNKSDTGMTFKQAFAKARKEAHGGKGQFEFGGKKYQTNIKGTGTKEKPQEKFISAGKQKVTSVKVGADSSAPKTPETPKTPEAPKAQEAPKTPEAPKAQEAPKTPEATKSDTEKPKASVTVASPDIKPPEDAPINEPQNKGADGADGASVNGGKGGKGGKGGQSLNECVQIGANKYRII